MKKLFFAITAGSMIASCASKPMTVQGPLVEYRQDKQVRTQNPRPKTIRGTWKDGECWIEGNDTIVYSYISAGSHEIKKYDVDPILKIGEKIRMIKCTEDGTYLLTEKELIILAGAGKVYFGKSEINLEQGRIKLGKTAIEIVNFLPDRNSIFLMTKDRIEYIDLENKLDSQVAGEFDGKSRMAIFGDVLVIVRPGKKAFLMTYRPGDGTAPQYGDGNIIFDGMVSFEEKQGKMFIKIGENELMLRKINEKIDLLLIK
jgi:hypothetical protein